MTAGDAGVAPAVAPRQAAAPSTTQAVIVLFDQTFVRATGAPQAETDTFTLPADVIGPFILEVRNGDANGQHEVSSGTVSLNGKEIVRAADLKDNNLNVPVALSQLNSILVRVASKPGSFLRVTVTGQRKVISYANATLAVALNYPSTWVVQASHDPLVVDISNVSEYSTESDASLEHESAFHLALRENANPGMLPIRQWFAADMSAHVFAVAPDTVSDIVVSGRKAVRTEMREIGNTAHIYIPLGTDVLEIWFGIFNPTFLPDYEAIVNSVRLSR